MKETKLFLPFFLSLALLFSACGGGSGENSRLAQEALSQTVEKAARKNMSPQEMGSKIGDLYFKAMQEVTEILKDRPDVSTVRPEVEKLKESYVQEFVELGRKRENLDEPDKRMVDSKVRQKVFSAGDQPWYATFNEIQQHYFSDQEFHKLVISFNIITQYAVFELLKKQEPEEAKRLGIE